MGLVLVVGNMVVFKLLEIMLLLMLCIVELMVEVGFFVGVVNIVFGYGYMVGQWFVEYLGVGKIVFIGLMVIGW